MTTVVLPTLAVAALVAPLRRSSCSAAGSSCGSGSCAASRRRRRPGRPRAADLWIGLAAVVLYLLVWNDARRRSAGPAWLVPVAARRQPGSCSAAPRLRGARAAGRRSVARSALVGSRRSALANQALGAGRATTTSASTTSGLIHYAEHYAAIPGLANLQSPLRRRRRASALRRVPRPRPLGGRRARTSSTACSRDAALRRARVALRLPARRRRARVVHEPDGAAARRRRSCIVVVLGGPTSGSRARTSTSRRSCSSPSGCSTSPRRRARASQPTAGRSPAAPRSPTAVGDAAALLALRRRSRSAVAVAAAPRRAGGCAALGSRSARSRRRSALAWMARQSILSGLPALPDDEPARLPRRLARAGSSVVDSQNDWDHAWARWPATAPSVVLGSWHWLRAFWLQHTGPRTRTSRCRSCSWPRSRRRCCSHAARAPAARRGCGRCSRYSSRASSTLVAWFFDRPRPALRLGADLARADRPRRLGAPRRRGRGPRPGSSSPARTRRRRDRADWPTLSGGVSGWLVPAVIARRR